MNLKQMICEVQDRNLLEVDVPEWQMKVYLSEISVAERTRLFDAIDAIDKSQDARLSVFILLFCLCDESGSRIFTDDDYEILASKNAKVVDRLGKMAAQHNNMMASAVDDAKKN